MSKSALILIFTSCALGAYAAPNMDSFREWAASSKWQRTSNATGKQDKAALECNFEVEKVYHTDNGASDADDVHDRVANSFLIIKQRGLYKDCMASKGWELVKPVTNEGSSHE